VIVASKGRFDRALTVKKRAAAGLPHESTVATEDFMALTLDVWSIPSESARRVGHPAPFPVELPEQLIRLYTFAGDLLLDPFMGSGSALVAAAKTGRRYVGYDLDPAYVDIARRRVAEATAATTARPEAHEPDVTDGKTAKDVAERSLVDAGFTITGRGHRVKSAAVSVDFAATDACGVPWLFDVAGPARAHRGGMLQTDVVWRALGRAHALREWRGTTPLVVLTTSTPRRTTEGDNAVRAAGPAALFDVVGTSSADDLERLKRYAKGGSDGRPLAGYWSDKELTQRLPA